MAANVTDGFADFLSTLKTTALETRQAASHRASIEAKLKEKFGITSFFRTGAFGSGTNIAGYSDVDYFAVIPTHNLKQDSGASLAQVAQALRERFDTTENIRVDCPGVQIPFGLDGAEWTEVVPADETGTTMLGYRSFEIPDGDGGWMFSAPDSHKAYVDWIDEKHDWQVKPLIRFMKAWKFIRDLPIKSFYLELYVAHYAAGEQAIIYDMDLALLFSRLQAGGLPDLIDPRFPDDGLVLRPCNTQKQREAALNAIDWAAQWSRQAFEHRQAGRFGKAFERWDLVFDYHFPNFTGS